MHGTALVLEDSKVQAGIIGRMLASLGWTAVHCETVREASEALTQMTANVLFLDVFVGAHNALYLMERFRSLAPGTPIILMTAGSSAEAIEDTLKHARRSGADYVLRKPFNDAILKDIFANIAPDLAQGMRRKHVLVIDDSVTVRTIAMRAFEQGGYRVSEAECMEGAIDDVDIAHNDLVLCDVFMPGMGGLKGMRTIKQTWPNVRIISMSAGLNAQVSDNDALNATRRAGADGQIKKPFAVQDLLELSAIVLGKAA